MCDKRSAILAFATLGAGSNDEARIRTVLSDLSPEVFPFHRRTKLRSLWHLLMVLRDRRPALAVMEGTGLAGGIALMLGRVIWGIPYVVSSGDAVGPWVGTK